MDGETLSFGTSGYTLDQVFVLYDRNSDSIWYPLSDTTFDAVAGERKGKKIQFLVEPAPMRLDDWLADHPDSDVLLPPQEDTAGAKRGYLGVQLGAGGLTIDRVLPDSGADRAGMLPGDRITRVGDTEVDSAGALRQALGQLEAGATVRLAVLRDGEQIELEATLGRAR